MKTFVKYLSLVLFVVLLGTVLLAAAAFLPQNSVRKHAGQTAEIIRTEGAYPRVIDGEVSSQLDNWTDSFMVMQSLTLNADDLRSVFLNRMYFDASEAQEPTDMVVGMVNTYLKDGPENMTPYDYVRYWGGFRVPVRLFLTFMNWHEVRRVLSFVFFAMMFLAACSIAEHHGSRMAFSFLLSMLLIKPQVICQSVNFMPCFLIAFAAILFVPWVSEKNGRVLPFFLIIGMVTQYFDFYSAPPVTFAFPAVCLIAGAWGNLSTRKALGRVGAALGMWLIGYGVMWLAKMTLTTIFTEVNGFQNAFLAFFQRTGIQKDATTLELYNMPAMFFTVLHTIVGGKKGALLYGMLAVALALAYIVMKKRGKGQAIPRSRFALLAVAMVTPVWFAISTQPTIFHAWFQYRMIVVTYFAGFAFLACSLGTKATNTK